MLVTYRKLYGEARSAKCKIMCICCLVTTPKAQCKDMDYVKKFQYSKTPQREAMFLSDIRDMDKLSFSKHDPNQGRISGACFLQRYGVG